MTSLVDGPRAARDFRILLLLLLLLLVLVMLLYRAFNRLRFEIAALPHEHTAVAPVQISRQLAALEAGLAQVSGQLKQLEADIGRLEKRPDKKK